MENNYNNTDIGGEILKSIQILSGTDTPMQMDFECIVTKKNDNKSYGISINGQEYSARNISGIELNPFDTVLVHCINGNFNNKVIIGKF